MGYRHYLYQVDKKLVDQIMACKNNEEYEAVFKSNIMGQYHDDYFPVYDLGKELFEFGKYYENAEEMYKHGESLFTSEELKEIYNDFGAIVIDKSGLLCAIEWQKNRIISLYEDLLREKSQNEYMNTNLSQFDRLKMSANDYLHWWKFGCYQLDDGKKHEVASSWLYEHTIFNLILIYKTFDWEKNCIIFCGW